MPNNYTHNFFPYPAKFPPEPILEYILKYTKEGDTILDPFCGSGTVLVESILNNRKAIGIDLNPVSIKVTEAKTTKYTKEDLEEVSRIIEEIDEILLVREIWISNVLEEKDIPNYKNIELWFKENMLLEMSALRKEFLLKNNYTKNVSNLLWMGFLKIVVDVSKQDTDTRYTAVEKEKQVDGYAIKKFQSTLKQFVKELASCIDSVSNQIFDVSILEGDANVMIDEIANNTVDLVITSPPYINTFDYYLYHKHRIFWLGKDPQYVRKNEIGNHHRIDTMTFEKAFEEYRNALGNLTGKIGQKLKSGKYYVMLVGDGIVKGNLVKADELMKEIALENGFVVEETLSMHFKEVSKGFIKGRNLDLKKHHTVIMKKI